MLKAYAFDIYEKKIFEIIPLSVNWKCCFIS